jgi:hypothetical protein
MRTPPALPGVWMTPGYRKIVIGNTIAKTIGIPKIREQCPHFNAWLTRIDNFMP